MKYDFAVKEISKSETLDMLQKYHYSNTLPRLNKHFLGFFICDDLVGVVTLGWGTRPKHTIKRLFPSLNTKDYYEIGRMCMTDKMPRNSESQMIKALCGWLKQNCPEIKVLFTWADGMLGKTGYVYQASGFTYAGFSWTDTYFLNGTRIHPRQFRSFLCQHEDDKRKYIRPTAAQLQAYHIEHYRGKQYRYIKFLCNIREKEALLKECRADLSLPNPKDSDLAWKAYDSNTHKWFAAEKPPYNGDYVCRKVSKEETKHGT